MPIKMVIDGAAVDEFLSRDGPVGAFMMIRSQVVQDAARLDCPKRTGKLSESIVKRFFDTPGTFSVAIAALQPYAVYVHEGTRPHIILPVKAQALRWYDASHNPVFASIVHHPGTKPHRFLSDNLHLFFAD